MLYSGYREKNCYMNGKISGLLRVDEMWNRLTELCARLWKENNSAAVPLQSLLEEFRAEVGVIEQILPEYDKSLRERVSTAEKNIKKDCELKIAEMDSRLADSAVRLAGAENKVKEHEKKTVELSGLLDAKNRELEETKARMPQAEAELNSKYTAKMQELYDQISRKEAELAAFWENRHKAVEEKAQSLEKQYREKINQLDYRAQSYEKELSSRKDELFRAFDKMRREMEAREAAAAQKEEMLEYKENELAQIEDRVKKGIKVTDEQ